MFHHVRMRIRREFLVVLAVSTLLAGCGSGGDGSSEEESAAHTSTSSVDPWAVPDPIDIAYVQRVVDEIEYQRDFVLDEIYSSHQFSSVSESRIRALYVEPYLDLALRRASEESMQDHPNVKADSAPARVPVKAIRSARTDCISAVVDVDTGPSVKAGGEVVEFAVTLRRADSLAESNITQWQESDWDGTSSDDGKVDRCVKS